MEKRLPALPGSPHEYLAQRLSDADGLVDRQPTDLRGRYERDRDRILYTSAFQRLAYVTQVTAPESGHSFHNRLSHSLKVAQVGRRKLEQLHSLVDRGEITGPAAELIRATDPSALEASCLAHDLGHPPFGHIAEQVLNCCAAEYTDGFEGNAQSFRIVTRLAVRATGTGLDLTRATLDGMLKYPWGRAAKDRVRSRKWGYYADDAGAYAFVRGQGADGAPDAHPPKSFAAELMDWADDVTYAVHDVDDFHRARLIPLDRIAADDRTETKYLERLLSEAKDADEANFPGDHTPDELAAVAHAVMARYGPIQPYRHTSEGRREMRTLGSNLITRFLDSFTVSSGADGAVVLAIDDEARREVAALKQLVNVYVIRRPGLAVVQHGQQRMVKRLFEYYFEESKPSGDRRIFPPGARERLEAAADVPGERARVVVDLISGLTENSVMQLDRRLSGGATAPALDSVALMG